jgi:hypothetical protein
LQDNSPTENVVQGNRIRNMRESLRQRGVSRRWMNNEEKT